VSLDQELRDYVDDAASPVAIEEVISRATTITPEADKSKRLGRGRVLVAAITLAGLGVGAGLIAWNGDGSESVSTFAAGDSVPAGSQEDALQIDPDSAWVPISDPASVFEAADLVETETSDGTTRIGTSGLRVNSMVKLPSGFFAVGGDVIGFRMLGAIWRSGDAESWERVSGIGDLFGTLDHEVGDIGPSGIEFHGIVEKEGVIVVAGVDTRNGGSPVAFRSVDGVAWESVQIEGPSGTFTSIHAVVATPEAFVIIGSDNADTIDGTDNAMIVWRSVDGRTWDRVPGPQIGLGALPAAAMSVAGRIVLVGSTGGFGGQAAAWTSDDAGLTWNAGSIPTSESDVRFSAMTHLASGPNGLLALGERRPQVSGGTVEDPFVEGPDGQLVNGEQDLAVWWSDDGSSWTEQDVVDLPESLELNTSLVSGSAGFLITTESITATESTVRVWVTSDGSDLTAVQAPDSGLVGASIATPDSYYILATPAHPFDNASLPEPTEDPLGLELWKLPTT